MITTVLVAWMASQSEHFNPWMLFLGTVWVDLAFVKMIMTIFG